MKSALRTLPLWLLLSGLSYLLFRAANNEALQTLASGALLPLPAVAVWLTACAVSALPENRLWRIPFWLGTAAGWSALFILTQGRAQAHAGEVPIVLSGLALAATAGIWLAIKKHTFPSWRIVGEIAAAFAILILATGAYAWRYDATTRAITARAEARWTEIGQPMAEFEKALAPSRENAGSAVVRQALREQVNAPFYKTGTRAGNREPVIQPSQAAIARIKGAAKLLSAKLPLSDDLTLPAGSTAAFEAASTALDADYRRILETEPATWASDPHDGFAISVPNFLGVRRFAQVASVDSLRRLAAGDQDGAARALDAVSRLRSGLLQNPTLVSLMITVAVDGLVSSERVRLPVSEEGLSSIAHDATNLRAEFLRRTQMEAWVALKIARESDHADDGPVMGDGLLPRWAVPFVGGRWSQREFATSALNGAEHAAIQKSPATLALPDLGASLHEAITEAHPTTMDPNFTRAIMRIHATLLLREQTELIRDARARLASGRPVESHDSVVLPGLRWELTADTEKGTVATRLGGAPEWIVKNEVTGNEFWVLPIDGSKSWQFHLPTRTANRL